MRSILYYDRIGISTITAGVSAVLGSVASRYCKKFAEAVVPDEDNDKRKKSRN